MSELFLGHPFIAPVIELARQAGAMGAADIVRWARHYLPD